jgi:taurine transport system permease protein
MLDPAGRPAPPPRAEAAKTSRYRQLGEGSGLAYSLAAIAAAGALWWLLTRNLSFAIGLPWSGSLAIELPLLKPLFMPKPESILFAFQQAMSGELDNHTLLGHFSASLARVFSAFAFAVIVGVPLGIGMSVSPLARGVFDPFIEFYRPLPPLAYLPLMIIWFGIGELAKVLLLFLAILAPVALSARAGAKSVAPEQIQAALSMGASRGQLIRYVVLPAALPDILVGLRIGMGVGWTTLVAAEMVAADAGLGKMVYNASNFLRTDVVVLGILVIGLVATAFELLMRLIERGAVPWKGKV